MHEIYLITNQINEKVYVGQTKQGLKKRFDQHAYEATRGCKYLLELAMKKYGDEFFTICPIVSGIQSWKEANRLETFWIKRLHSTDRGLGYNLSEGGEGIRDVTGEVARKLSAATKRHLNGDPKKNPAYRHDVPTDDLVRLHSEGLSRQEIADKFGVSYSLVHRRFKKLGIPASADYSNKDEDIARLYADEKYTSTEVASLLKISTAKVWSRLQKLGIALRPAGSRPRLAIATEKVCPRCEQTFELNNDNCYPNSNTLNGWSYYCKPCDNAQSNESKRRTKLRKLGIIGSSEFVEEPYLKTA